MNNKMLNKTNKPNQKSPHKFLRCHPIQNVELEARGEKEFVHLGLEFLKRDQRS